MNRIERSAFAVRAHRADGAGTFVATHRAEAPGPSPPIPNIACCIHVRKDHAIP